MDEVEATWITSARHCNILGELAGLRDINLENVGEGFDRQAIKNQSLQTKKAPSIAVPNSPELQSEVPSLELFRNPLDAQNPAEQRFPEYLTQYANTSSFQTDSPSSQSLNQSIEYNMNNTYPSGDPPSLKDGWEVSIGSDKAAHVCIIKLGHPSSISGFDIDTSYFHTEERFIVSVECAYQPTDSIEADHVQWIKILDKVELSPSSHNFFELKKPSSIISHIRICAHSNGGIARFHAYSQSTHPLPNAEPSVITARPLTTEDYAPYGDVIHAPGARSMTGANQAPSLKDGWEVNIGSDKAAHVCTIRLGHPSNISGFDIDTSYFHTTESFIVSVECAYQPTDSIEADHVQWIKILDKVKLSSSSHNFFELKKPSSIISHIRIYAHSNGGIARFHAYSQSTHPLPNAEPSVITARPLTTEDYAPYGDVIHAPGARSMTGANQVVRVPGFQANL
ncbi:hypothetical protein RMCBS344292_06556 [Rhizopus microsporus]|nr:hypothetical protein RMCBS344292_06556 [Rhizopus microsporus]